MKYDTIIIGGGLSGLASGIRLSSEGQKCAIITQGQSAIHFSSGSFDLLNFLPDGTATEKPLDAIDRLISMNPSHPYSKLGKERFEMYSGKAPEIFAEAGMKVTGSNLENHMRISPMGESKPTWLTLDGYLTYNGKPQWKDIVIFNIEGFLDFYPEFIAEGLRKKGVHCRCEEISLPGLSVIRKNPTEMRSPNIARVFDKQENISLIADNINSKCGSCEAVILPAVIGISRENALDELRSRCDRQIYMLPTLPPSIPGIQAQQKLQRTFRHKGGEYFLGDTVIKADMEKGIVRRVYSANHGNIPFEADNFILATGSFFSKGIIATPDRVYEPIFGADTEYLNDRSGWYDLNFFEKQKYMEFGIRSDNYFHVIKDGKAIDNLYVTGAGLSGFNPIHEGCGAGVSILTSLFVSDLILKGGRL